MILSIVFILAGIVLLYYSAEWLVLGASRLALHFGVSSLVIGLTVVSFGTSAPEWFSSMAAQFTLGSGNVAVGNIVGSNIYNIGAVLGVAAFLCPLTVHSKLIRREVPLCILVSGLFLLILWDGSVSRWEGLILLACFVAYLILQFLEARRNRRDDQLLGEYAEKLAEKKDNRLWVHGGMIAAGSIGLAVGSHLLVANAIELGQSLGISERVIGLTAVAFGTSLPELATSIVAAARKEPDIAIGNVVGSNIFNILLAIGSVAAVSPMTFDRTLFTRDAPFMLGLTILMMLLISSGRKLQKLEGAILFLAATLYTIMLFVWPELNFFSTGS